MEESYKTYEYELPIPCTVKVCLYNDGFYCWSDAHKITPNTLECEKMNSYIKEKK